MKTIILAAGQGKRLESEKYQIPKAMRAAGGKPLLGHILETLAPICIPGDTYIVVGYMKEQIISAFSGYNFVEQTERLGTGHAARCAKEALADYDGEVLILAGDTPLVTLRSLRSLIAEHEQSASDCTVLTCCLPAELRLGRIVREGGRFTGIVEDRDCTPEQRNIREYNTGVLIADSRKLFGQLDCLRSDNSQKEYYLTDIPALFIGKGYGVGAAVSNDERDILGVNTMEDLAKVEEYLRKRK